MESPATEPKLGTNGEKISNKVDDLDENEQLHVSSDFENKNGDEDDDDIATIRTGRKKRKGFNILDSEDEDEEDQSRKVQDDRDHSAREKSDLEGNDSVEERTSDVDEEESNQFLTKEEHNQNETVLRNRSPLGKYKGLIDSDTDSEPDMGEPSPIDDSMGAREETAESEAIRPSSKKRNDLPKRMSAKKAEEQMRAIKSECQRIHRECYVTIPYHQPKQYSLKEFMSRKTITKPNSNEPVKRFSLKMSQDELEEFAKQLEEREKEATVFFKSDDRKDQAQNMEKKNKTEKIDAQINKHVNEAETQLEDKEKPFSAEDREIDGSQDEIIPSTQDQLRDDEVQPMEIDKAEKAQENDSQSVKNTPATSQYATQNESDGDDLFISATCESVTIPETEESLLDQCINPSESQSVKLSLTENIQELLKERDMVQSPILMGSPNMLIDLDTGDVVAPTPSGVDKLVERFLKHSAKRKPKAATNMSIVSTENGTLEVTNVCVHLNEEEVKEEKPRAAYFKLKDNLMKAIMKRRKEELQKKIERNKDVNMENDEDDEEYEYDMEKERLLNDDEEEVIYDDEEENVVQGEDEDEFDEIDESPGEERQEVQNNEKDTEADDELESDEDDEGSDGDDSDDDDDLLEEPKAIKTRIISAFNDSDDETETDCLNINLNLEKNDGLWNDETKECGNEDNELLDLCSGQFDITQKNQVISQIPTTQVRETVDENELLYLCSGTFEERTQVQDASANETEKSPLPVSKRLESSDEETEGKDSRARQKTKRKKMQKLDFSDDEEEEEMPTTKELENIQSNHNLEEDEPSEVEEHENDIPETYVDYDSEENEIEVKMTKTDCRDKASEFFEKEAELSESEWGSADEDEKDLDRYEIDAADEEIFDKDKLQAELGRIHMRRVLDDDIREVKKIQELLFEDEETDGIGRQRQFRWKNLAGEDLDLAIHDDGGEGNRGSDDENDEATWRKMRFERELVLQENAKKVSISESALRPDVNNSLGKKLTFVSVNSATTTISEKSSPFLITKAVSTSRGSFLLRDAETLTKLANITKTGSIQETDGVQVRTGKAKNFVFASLNPVDAEKSLKRKAAGGEQETEAHNSKKVKIGTKRKIRLIDHLA